MSQATATKSDQSAIEHERIPDREIKARCDADGIAAARVRVELKTGGHLFFCGHHYNESMVELLPLTMSVKDEREWKPEVL